MLLDVKKQLSLKKSNLFLKYRSGNVIYTYGTLPTFCSFLFGVIDVQNGFHKKLREICLTLGAKKWIWSVSENVQILSESSSISSE